MQKKIAWINVNRKCNLKCSWCYDNSLTQLDKQLDKSLLFNLIDFCYSGSIRKIVFLGGEPTLYPYLADALIYCKKLGITTEITTNGLLLADETYLDFLIENGLNSVMLSIKGVDAVDYKNVTGQDGYMSALNALRNLAQRNIKYGSSFVLTADSINNIVPMVNDLVCNNVPLLVFSFAKNYANNNEAEIFRCKNSPHVLLPILYKKYMDNISIFCKIKWCFELCVPLKFNIKKYDDFILQYSHFSCKNNKEMPLIFNEEACLLLCNTMPDKVIGQYGKEFNTYDEYLQYVKYLGVDL